MTFSDSAKLKTADWIEIELEKALGAICHVNTADPKSASADLMHWSGGKLFEFYSFVHLLKKLKQISGCSLTVKKLHLGNVYLMNGGPAPLHPTHSHVEINTPTLTATAWQSVEFSGISCPPGGSSTAGDYHEADILILEGASPTLTTAFFPPAADILLVMECKFTADMPKAFLRNMLGLRREMSYVSRHVSTPFGAGGGASFKAKLPASRGKKKPVDRFTSHLILAYSFALSGKNLNAVWASPASEFGIEYWKL